MWRKGLTGPRVQLATVMWSSPPQAASNLSQLVEEAQLVLALSPEGTGCAPPERLVFVRKRNLVDRCLIFPGRERPIR